MQIISAGIVGKNEGNNDDVMVVIFVEILKFDSADDSVRFYANRAII